MNRKSITKSCDILELDKHNPTQMYLIRAPPFTCTVAPITERRDYQCNTNATWILLSFLCDGADVTTTNRGYKSISALFIEKDAKIDAL